MIAINHEHIEHVPCLIVEQLDRQHEPLPLLVYFHGITSAKEHNLPVAYLLAEAGFRVVLPDSHLHGEREGGISAAAREFAFWDIIFKNTAELQIIREHFVKSGLIQDGRISVAGTSMGGITTAACLKKYDWVRSAAIMMGTAELGAYAKLLVKTVKSQGTLPFDEAGIAALYKEIADYDISETPGVLNGRPLLIWHGENDPVIPYSFATAFYEEARAMYEDQTKIRLISEPNRGHKVSRKAILEAVRWFKQFG